MPADRFEHLKLNNPQGEFVDLELFFCTEVLKLRSLHYGYWENGADLTIGNLKHAQAAYTDSLLQLIPTDVNTVLDVGCGLGDNAKAMADRGLVVTAISPDIEHEKFVSQIENITYQRTTFEDYRGDAGFDLILMSESQNYFDRDVGFEQCRRLLSPGGYLLVSGMLRRDGATAFPDINSETEYIDAAAGFGLRLKQSIDITAQTLPTIRLAQQAYADHVRPVVRMADYYLNHTARWKMKMLRIFFRRQFKHLNEIKSWIDTRIDPDHFEKHVKYLRLLFQSGDGAAAAEPAGLNQWPN